MGPYEQRLCDEHLERRRKFYPPPVYVVPEPPPEPEPEPETAFDFDMPTPPVGQRSAQNIVRWAANRFGWRVHEFTRPGRPIGVVIARTATVYIVQKKLPHISLASISRALRRDHTTYVKNLRKFEFELERRPVLAKFINNLMAELD